MNKRKESSPSDKSMDGSAERSCWGRAVITRSAHALHKICVSRNKISSKLLPNVTRHCHKSCLSYELRRRSNKRIGCRRGTARRCLSVEILSTASPVHEKTHLKRSLKVIGNGTVQ